ncbi:flagellar biosynthesis protein FlhB [Peribacillus cavernae]|uniref:Flagellar biosynthetic protein FlhB n=1 Tax=Peribacillus cavernae TaxID=1674310 RepID=A0A3S0U3W1_9BACI|nr:flagellar biosynthesis protein FlhB [Peribacillus cavernae]MDQ0217060.1 flagellar biosynthetic protein FlhB [Peribacillus cavernae]RUQ30462.1 flagellar biosynthesis protein FlhB [Peribacillus cavernae]
MNWLQLDLQFFSGEKTEKATPKKRQDARKKGQAAKSQDVNTAVVLLAVFMLFIVAGPFMKETIIGLFTESFQESMLTTLTEENVQSIFMKMLKESAIILAPVFGVALLAGIAANFMQIGFMFSTEAIQFKLEKIDPIKGFKRIFSLRAIVELLKSILKIALVGLVAFFVIWQRMDDIMTLSQTSAAAAMAVLADITVDVGLYASAVLLFLALLDFLYQKYDFEKTIRMSKQDIKDEYKNIEGDPLIKSKIKQKQREMAMQRMMQEVPRADVVITNPTHYAIALKYDEQKLDAPYVIAKGVDFVAQKIKYVAKENDIVMMENRQLARALYGQTEIGQAIPEEFFKAVAEILAFVYKTKGQV